MLDALRHILSAPAEAAPLASLSEWWTRHREEASHWRAPIDQALCCGFSADRLSYAFASGYQAALRALYPGLPALAMASLCATERGGAHPRAISTTLGPEGEYRWLLSGEKTFATLAPAADLLLVVASTGDDEAGKKRLRLARVEAGAPGVSVSALPALPLAPEIPHGLVRFTEVLVLDEDVLPGDGYERYLKPFRTIEDCHVLSAFLGYVAQLARRHSWPRGLLEELAGAALSLRTLALEAPNLPEVHLALAGVLRGCRRLFEASRAELSSLDEETRGRYARDLGLLSVAEQAREKRAEAAWRVLSPGR